MSAHRVWHVAIEEHEAFDLGPEETILSAEYESPYVHLVILAPLDIDGLVRVEEDVDEEG